MNAAKETSRALADALLPVRDRFAHKGDFGKVLLLCGSVGYTGAAAMAARAALRTGSGLIFLGVPEAVYPILAAKLDEPIVFPLPDDGFGRLSEEALPEILWRLRGCDACLAGPGLGQSDGVRAIIAGLLGGKVPLVLDADGINVLSGHIDLLRGAACPVVVTPHEGEFRRLGGELDALSRQEAAERLASDAGCVVLLKATRPSSPTARKLMSTVPATPAWRPAAAGTSSRASWSPCWGRARRSWREPPPRRGFTAPPGICARRRSASTA